MLPIRGRVFLFASSMGDTPATPAMATMIPAMGDAARPMLADNCKGKHEGIGRHTQLSGNSGQQRAEREESRVSASHQHGRTEDYQGEDCCDGNAGKSYMRGVIYQ